MLELWTGRISSQIQKKNCKMRRMLAAVCNAQLTRDHARMDDFVLTADHCLGSQGGKLAVMLTRLVSSARDVAC